MTLTLIQSTRFLPCVQGQIIWNSMMHKEVIEWTHIFGTRLPNILQTNNIGFPTVNPFPHTTDLQTTLEISRKQKQGKPLKWKCNIQKELKREEIAEVSENICMWKRDNIILQLLFKDICCRFVVCTNGLTSLTNCARHLYAISILVVLVHGVATN